jgi:hypothetical protein
LINLFSFSFLFFFFFLFSFIDQNHPSHVSNILEILGAHCSFNLKGYITFFSLSTIQVIVLLVNVVYILLLIIALFFGVTQLVIPEPWRDGMQRVSTIASFMAKKETDVRSIGNSDLLAFHARSQIRMSASFSASEGGEGETGSRWAARRVASRRISPAAVIDVKEPYGDEYERG